MSEVDDRFERARQWLTDNLAAPAEQPQPQESLPLPEVESLTLQEVADLLHLHYESVRRLAKAGAFPTFMAGKVYRVPRKEFELWRQRQLQSETIGRPPKPKKEKPAHETKPAIQVIAPERAVSAPMMNEIQAAIYLGLTKSTLRNWRSEGRGPVFHKMGRNIRYDVADLNQYKDDTRRQPVA